MKTVEINHNAPHVTAAMGLDNPEGLSFIKTTITKIVDRTIETHEYKKSNSLQDIITAARISCGEDPAAPITEVEVKIVFTAWQLGMKQQELQLLCKLTDLKDTAEHISAHVRKRNL